MKLHLEREKMSKMRSVGARKNLSRIRRYGENFYRETQAGCHFFSLYGVLGHNVMSICRGKATKDAEKFVGRNERSGIMYEGLHLFTQYGEREGLVDLRKDEPYMDFAGSRDGSGDVPCLYRWYGGLGLSADLPGDASPRDGSVSAGVPLNS